MLGEYLTNLRRNHALEHATVSLLLSRLGPDIRVVGRASGDGFFLYGDIPSNLLVECAREGLARLQRGEAFWAVTPHCGTNIATAGFLAALSMMAATGKSPGKDRFGRAMVAAMVGIIAAQPIGRFLQRYVTTCADLAGMEIVAIEERGRGRFYKVRTKRQSAGQAA
ncbi:MAG TPA: DUF6391 domain-containing protein [Dehalococcoidia bacterium]|nr:DUF6391 domain-containing protein [Dehalococcoidia bacterium]